MTAATAPLEHLEPQEVARLLAQRKILLVDVREPHEYATQRIQGAVLSPLSSLDASYLPPDDARKVVFQCGTGKRSEMAARARLASGAPQAAHLAGGLGAWVAAGLPVMHIDPATGKPL